MDPDHSPAVRYGGVTFGSRLAARWAVLFDQLELAWDQPAAYMLAGPPGEPARPYLPELHLPGLGVWVHVAATLTADDLHAVAAAVMPGGLPAHPDHDGGPARVLLVGQLPRIAAPRPQHWHVGLDSTGVAVGVYDLDTRRPTPAPSDIASRWPPGPAARLWEVEHGWSDLDAAAAVLSRQPYTGVQASPQLTRACAAARTARLPAA